MLKEVAKNKTNSSPSTLVNAALATDFPMAVWRLPQETRTHFLLSKNYDLAAKEINFEDSRSGFVIAPFMSDNGMAHFLPAEYYFCKEKGETVDFNSKLEEWALKSAPKSIIKKTQVEKEDYTDFNEFINSATKAIKEIENGTFEKVVISRSVDHDIPEGFEIMDHFEKLCTAYPDAFVSMTYLPWKNQIWMCASPETLVSQNDKGIFSTIALAGTQSSFDSNGDEIKPKEALWSQKEIEEQALVSRYIINCFKKIRVREFDEIGPKTIKAGNLLHLGTVFKVQANQINFSQLGSVMLKLLHPTSAVCGMPKEAAKQFLSENEHYDRSFYSGFLGPVNINGSSNIFVNLRTLKIENSYITTYAGCGITVDSSPQKEWKETELKMQTVLLQHS